jgi:hypothetical protein
MISFHGESKSTLHLLIRIPCIKHTQDGRSRDSTFHASALHGKQSRSSRRSLKTTQVTSVLRLSRVKLIFLVPHTAWVEKYRPKTIDDVSSQDHTVAVLQKTLTSTNVSVLGLQGIRLS